MTLSGGAVVNIDQAAAWDGDEGSHWAAHAESYDLGIVRHQEHLLAGAALTVTDRVIDVGCGNGATSLAAAAAVPDGSVLGVDLSSPMLAVARSRADAAGFDHVSFVQADAQVHPFPSESADVVISRFGAMFFLDLEAAYTNLARALRPGGRLAVLAWQAMADNEWQLVVRGALAGGRDLPMPPAGAVGTPFGLADRERDLEIMAAVGFTDVAVEPVLEPITLGVDVEGAFAFISTTGIAQGLLGDLDAEARADALGTLRSVLEGHVTPDGVQAASAAWLLTATKPG